MWGDQSFYEYTEDGTPYKLNPGSHVVVAYGYDDIRRLCLRSGDRGGTQLLDLGRFHVAVECS